MHVALVVFSTSLHQAFQPAIEVRNRFTFERDRKAVGVYRFDRVRIDRVVVIRADKNWKPCSQSRVTIEPDLNVSGFCLTVRVRASRCGA